MKKMFSELACMVASVLFFFYVVAGLPFFFLLWVTGAGKVSLEKKP